MVSLPSSEKLELIEALWDSLADSVDELPVLEWQKEELDRRKQAHTENPDSVVTWEEAKARIPEGGG